MSDIGNSPKKNRNFSKKISDYSEKKRRQSKSLKLTKDQKRFRILMYLHSNREGVFLNKLSNMSMRTVQPNTEPEFLTQMIEDKWIKKHAIRNENRLRYFIDELGEQMIETMIILKTKCPDNPILKFDVFQISQYEKDKLEGDDFENNLQLSVRSDEEIETLKKKLHL